VVSGNLTNSVQNSILISYYNLYLTQALKGLARVKIKRIAGR